MKRISTTTRVVDKFGAGKDGYTDGDVGGGIPATDLEAGLFDNLQEEIANVVEGSGIALNGAVLTQLRQAVKRLFGGNVTTVNAANSPLVLTADHAGLVLMDATAGNISATLPAAALLTETSAKFRFVRLDATGNTATVNRAGADTFLGGGTAFTLGGGGDWRHIESDLISKWVFVGASGKGRQAFFVSSSTWTCPGDVTSVIVSMCGGGGGGGGATGSTGGGGGGGAQCRTKETAVVVPGTSYTVTIGAGGAGGGPDQVGIAGGVTSFGILLSTSGGSGGARGTFPTAGGAAGGAGGVDGGTGGSAGAGVVGGSGGGTRYGGGGLGGASTNVGGAGGSFGGGGGGGNASASGGAGAGGFIHIEW